MYKGVALFMVVGAVVGYNYYGDNGVWLGGGAGLLFGVIFAFIEYRINKWRG